MSLLVFVNTEVLFIGGADEYRAVTEIKAIQDGMGLLRSFFLYGGAKDGVSSDCMDKTDDIERQNMSMTVPKVINTVHN